MSPHSKLNKQILCNILSIATIAQLLGCGGANQGQANKGGDVTDLLNQLQIEQVPSKKHTPPAKEQIQEIRISPNLSTPYPLDPELLVWRGGEVHVDEMDGIYSTIAQKEPLTITQKNLKSKELSSDMFYVKTLLGGGGSKLAYEFGESSVLVLPSPSAKWEMTTNWPRIVHEEVQMSQHIKQLGLPVLELTPASIRNSNRHTIPTYTSPTFQSLTKDGTFILDRKKSKSSTWPFESAERFVPQGKDIFCLDDWFSLARPLVDDVFKLVQSKIILADDSLNLLVATKGSIWHTGSSAPYEARFFGFDFSHPKVALSKPTLAVKLKRAKFMLETLLRGLFSADYEQRCQMDEKLANQQIKLEMNFEKELRERLEKVLEELYSSNDL